MNDCIGQDDNGMFRLALSPCYSTILRYLLDPAVPFVYLLDHMPNETLQWWNVDMPLAKDRPARPFHVRMLQYDVCMRTSEFLQHIEDVKGLGMDVLQTSKELPATLIPRRIDESNRMKALLANGLESRFYLPHAMEVAVFRSRTRETIERALRHEQVLRLALPA